MKIVIDKILDENIYFSTDYGMAKGIWKGANRPIQKEYYVELDIDGLYSYDNVFVNNTKEYQMMGKYIQWLQNCYKCNFHIDKIILF